MIFINIIVLSPPFTCSHTPVIVFTAVAVVYGKLMRLWSLGSSSFTSRGSTYLRGKFVHNELKNWKSQQLNTALKLHIYETEREVSITDIWHWHALNCEGVTLSSSSPDAWRFSIVKSPITLPSSPQHMSIIKYPLSSYALIWCSVNMALL